MDDRPSLGLELSRQLARRQLKNREILVHSGHEETEEELDSFASQLLGRMRQFLFSRRLEPVE
jgi:hypothetical protein